MKFLELNHVALHVKDVDKSCDFYENVLQLKKIPRRADDRQHGRVGKLFP